MNSTSAAAIAREQLKRCAAAASKLSVDDAESLHVFRVGLRRLLTHLKACRRAGKGLKRLRKVFKTTGPWRDAQVKYDWLMEYARRSGEEWSLEPLLLELEEAQGQGRTEAIERIKESFGKAARRLRGRLPKGSARVKAKELRPVLRRRAKEAARRLEAVKSPGDVKRLHRARIAVKKLRYTLEAFSRYARATAGLRDLQTLLGELNDRDMIAGMLHAASEGGVADPAAIRKAVTVLEEERRTLFLKAKRRGLGAPKKLRNLV